MKGVTLVLREKRTITKEEKEYLLSLKPSDITLPLLQELFADTYDPVKKKVIPSKFNTYDEFSLSKNEYFNKEDIKVTNCGLFILNKFLFEEKLVDIVGYVNTPFDKKTIGKVQSKLDAALLEDKIDSETYIEFLVVSNKRRRQGVGTQLIKYCQRQLLTKKLTLYVAAENTRAIKLYQKNNFVVRKVQHSMLSRICVNHEKWCFMVWEKSNEDCYDRNV